MLDIIMAATLMLSPVEVTTEVDSVLPATVRAGTSKGKIRIADSFNTNRAGTSKGKIRIGTSKGKIRI